MESHPQNPEFRNNPELSKIPILKLAVCLLNINNFKFKRSIVLRQTQVIQKLIKSP